MVIVGGWVFIMSEVLLHGAQWCDKSSLTADGSRTRAVMRLTRMRHVMASHVLRLTDAQGCGGRPTVDGWRLIADG